MNDATSNRHAKAGALSLGSKEGLKDALLLFGGKTRAAISDADDDSGTLAIGLFVTSDFNGCRVARFR